MRIEMKVRNTGSDDYWNCTDFGVMECSVPVKSFRTSIRTEYHHYTIVSISICSKPRQDKATHILLESGELYYPQEPSLKDFSFTTFESEQAADICGREFA
jgi:hypothetical protein